MGRLIRLVQDATGLTPWYDIYPLWLPDEPVITGVTPIVSDLNRMNEEWYTIDGLILHDRPKIPGIYINAGKKIIIK